MPSHVLGKTAQTPPGVRTFMVTLEVHEKQFAIHEQALRARLVGDMNQMEAAALNKAPELENFLPG